jgi:hypothetical protein
MDRVRNKVLFNFRLDFFELVLARLFTLSLSLFAFLLGWRDATDLCFTTSQ